MFTRSTLRYATAFAASAAPSKSPLPHNLPLSSSTLAKTEINHMRPVHYSSLANGFRVACEYVPNTSFSTIGVWIDAGSRFENKSNNGVAHFLEHLNFKGTKNFSKQDIENCFERLGAHFNAYTSRDRTAYYIKVFNKDVEQVLTLLSDVLKNGVYDPTYVELERPTILAEMREVEELVDEVIMDNVHQCAFDSSTGCGLPLTILGPVENISKTITRETVLDYIQTHYTGPRMMLVSVGGISPEEAHRYAEKYFSDLPSHSNRPLLSAKYLGGHHTMWNDAMVTTQTALTFPMCGASHPDAVPLQLVHNVIGQYVREAHDQFLYQRFFPKMPQLPDLMLLKPFFTPYEDVSLLGYRFVTYNTPPSPSSASSSGAISRRSRDQNSQTKMLDFLLQSFYEICHKGPTEALLEEAKCEYKASQVIMTDSTTNSAENIGRQMVHFGRRVPIPEIFDQVDAVTPKSLQDTLAKYFGNVTPTVCAIGPSGSMPNFDQSKVINAKLSSLV